MEELDHLLEAVGEEMGKSFASFLPKKYRDDPQVQMIDRAIATEENKRMENAKKVCLEFLQNRNEPDAASLEEILESLKTQEERLLNINRQFKDELLKILRETAILKKDEDSSNNEKEDS